MKVRNLRPTFLAVIALALSGRGTILVGQETTALNVRAGAVVYENPDFGENTLIEFPFVLSREEFEFFHPDSSDSAWYARIFAQVRLLKYDGMAVDSSSVYFSARVATIEESKKTGIRLFNNVSLLVEPGVYSARLTVVDVVSKKKGTVFYERIVTSPPDKDSLRIGGTALAYDITYAGNSDTDRGDRLIKNGFRVLVNPLRVYSTKATSIYFYGELYNLVYDGTEKNNYTVGYQITDNLDQLVENYGFKRQPIPGKSAVIAEELDISGLKEGKYTLHVVASDMSSGQSDTVKLGFTILSRQSDIPLIASVKEFDPYDTLSLEVKVNLVKYQLSPAEAQTLHSLDDESRERFLNQFWRERDPTPSTYFNELRFEQIKRYEFANQNFSSNRAKDNGWSTDRGRIYMIYGPWERKKYVDLPQKTDPFEVWYYYSVEEGAVFVFVDKEAFFDKTLIHSNVEGELYSATWDRTLKDLDLLEDF